MFKVLEDLPDGVVGISATGKIGGDDYETTLEPAISQAVERHGKIALLMVLGPDFEGYSAGAVFDDLRFGLRNFNTFRRIAIVSDNQWLRNGAAAMMYLVPGRSKGFSVDQLAAARTWISQED